MAKAKVFPVAYQQEWLLVTRIHRKSMAAIAFAIFCSLSGKIGLIVAALVEFEYARVTVTIRDIDRSVGAWKSGSEPPLIRTMKSGFGWGNDLLYHRSIGFDLDEQPVLFGR